MGLVPAGLGPARDGRGPGRDLAGAAAVPAGRIDVDEGLAARDAGSEGGPIEVRVAGPPVEGRASLAPMDALLPAFEGVPVRELGPLDPAAIDTCLVGDFVGDWVSRR